MMLTIIAYTALFLAIIAIVGIGLVALLVILNRKKNKFYLHK